MNRVVYNYWSGEYPIPVINVHATRSGFTKIYPHKSLRQLNQKVICTIKNGLYHPWSNTSNSIVDYYTITALEEYKVLKNTVLDNRAIKKGRIITNVHYLSEGYCRGNIKSNAKGKSIEFYCDDLKTKSFKKIANDDNFFEQWLYVKCREGYNAFVKDSELLKQAGIKEGKIKGYGSVSK